MQKKGAIDIKTAAQALGREGGLKKSERKTKASRENAKKAGRPLEPMTRIENVVDNAIYAQSPHDGITRHYLNAAWRRIRREAAGDLQLFAGKALLFLVTAGCAKRGSEEIDAQARREVEAIVKETLDGPDGRA